MINVPYAGHTNPTLPLSAELVGRGHTVTSINAPEFGAAIEATGAEFVPYVDWPEGPSEQQKKRLCFTAAFRTAARTAAESGTKFDVLVYEMFFYPGKAIADRLGIPCVRQFSQPAWNPEMVREASLSWRIFCALIDRQVMGRRTARDMGMAGKTLISSTLFDRADLNVVYVPKLFQRRSESFDDSYVFVCPPPQDRRDPVRSIPFADMAKPIIYVSLGSIISSKTFYRRCVRAFGDQDVSVILNTGKVDPDELGPIPRNVVAHSFVPQIEVLRNADLFVTHCGMNSVNEAMGLGVPMLAMPIVNDQIGNARRIAELGIGLRVRPFPSTAGRLYRSAMTVLDDARIRQNASSVREAIAADDGIAEVAARLEELVG